MSGKGDVSQAFIARSLGLSAAAITKLKKQGMPVDSVDAALAWREQRLNIAARKPTPGAKQKPLPINAPSSTLVRPAIAPVAVPDEDHAAARTRREIAEANLAEMREAEERRELVRLAAVKSMLAKVISSTRDSLLQLPSRLAQVLSAESDPNRVRDLLDAEIHQALSRLVASHSKIVE
jgi:phage terminase Nu1 subunit (DNA packaging protein)